MEPHISQGVWRYEGKYQRGAFGLSSPQALQDQQRRRKRVWCVGTAGSGLKKSEDRWNNAALVRRRGRIDFTSCSVIGTFPVRVNTSMFGRVQRCDHVPLTTSELIDFFPDDA